MKLGRKIRDIRHMLNITQEELCEGICSQSQISKIEAGNISPYTHTFIQIANKLGIDPGHLIKHMEHEKYYHIYENKKLIRKHIRKREFQEVKRYIDRLSRDPVFYSQFEEQQFILWHKGILSFYLDQNYTKSFDELIKALKMSPGIIYSLQEIEIINSIAVIQFECGFYEMAINKHEHLISLLKNSPFKFNEFVLIRIYFNLSLSYYNIKKYQKSLNLIIKGIKLILELESNYLLGEFYFQKGLSFWNLGEKDLAFESLNKASNIFYLTSNITALNIVQFTIKNYYANHINGCKKPNNNNKSFEITD